ncbi:MULTISPECIES: TadE/TadG family type IV pilus assembly protein [unclassified Phenylobacterium]|uniref:TadE/TadG family type IV pilus assembly protein n=1 Tax=unclassified Phenylobacterium TaxID=2640670 RepID=UPI0009EAD4EF|nr:MULTISPECIES: TadE/TadG family type IV pilus assembly protein [unclassified Phenylobacterium]
MTRSATRLRAWIRRFVRSRRGATAVEFALISIPLMMLMFGVLELAMILLVSATLDTATDFAARNIRTGVFQAGSSGAPVSQQGFRQLVCVNMSWLEPMCTLDAPAPGEPDPSPLFVESRTFANFAAASALPERDPNTFDPQVTNWCAGNPEDIVVVTTYFKWPIVTPLLRPVFQNFSGGRMISSTRLFRNEPFNPALPRLGNNTSC